MKISMWIIKDYLSDYIKSTNITSGKMEITSVQLYSEQINMSNDNLYICTFKEYFGVENSDIICFNQNDFIYFNTSNFSLILNKVLEAFKFYYAWSDKITNMLSYSDTMLSDLINESSSVLPYPVFVLDKSHYVIGISKNFDKKNDDPNWNELIEFRSPDFERIKILNQQFPQMYKWKHIYKFPEELTQSHSYRQNIFFGDTWIGAYSVVDKDDNFSFGILDIIQLLGNFISQWMILHTKQSEVKLMDILFTDAVNGQKDSLPNFENQLKISGWNNSDKKVLIKLVSTSDIYNISEHLHKTLLINLKNVFIITQDSSILILSNISKTPLENTLNEIKKWIKISKYCGWISSEFTDISIISEQNMQLNAAAKYGRNVIGEIADCRNYLLYFGAEIMKSHLNFDISHHSIEELKKYDIENNTQYTETLENYLKNERNQQKTANLMNLHRSSLIYRLKKIDDIIDIDLDDPIIRLHLLFSFEFLSD